MSEPTVTLVVGDGRVVLIEVESHGGVHHCLEMKVKTPNRTLASYAEALADETRSWDEVRLEFVRVAGGTFGGRYRYGVTRNGGRTVSRMTEWKSHVREGVA